jgi:rare lipoprotein A
VRILLALMVLFCLAARAVPDTPPLSGSAAWYGEELRGKLMANGKRFDPERLTAACWFYPLGTRLRVTASGSTNTVEVVVTDRGPGRSLVREGRILDLSRAAFERLANAERGVIGVRVQK